jgi:hypothetical protein
MKPHSLQYKSYCSNKNILQIKNNFIHHSYNDENLNEKKETNIIKSLKLFLSNNWLVLGEIIVIAFAKYNPAFGATGGVLKPEITISKIGVFIIFFINGIALSLS